MAEAHCSERGLVRSRCGPAGSGARAPPMRASKCRNTKGVISCGFLAAQFHIHYESRVPTSGVYLRRARRPAPTITPQRPRPRPCDGAASSSKRHGSRRLRRAVSPDSPAGRAARTATHSGSGGVAGASRTGSPGPAAAALGWAQGPAWPLCTPLARVRRGDWAGQRTRQHTFLLCFALSDGLG